MVRSFLLPLQRLSQFHLHSFWQATLKEKTLLGSFVRENGAVFVLYVQCMYNYCRKCSAVT